MNLSRFLRIGRVCLFAAASLPWAVSASAQGMNVDLTVERMNSLLRLTSAQQTAVTQIVTRENAALQNLAAGRDRAIQGMPIRQAAHDQLRALLTPAQQALFDITPQFKGGGAQSDPAMMVSRLNRLVHLSADQVAGATAVFDHQLQALGPLTAAERQSLEGMKPNQDMRAGIRALLTPEQQAIYDISPQMEGGGATVNPANRTSDLDRTVTLTDTQILQVAALYQKQVEALAALPPENRKGTAVAPIFQITRAEIRALLTPEQQAKWDANPSNAPDLEERAYVASVVKSSTALVARIGTISRVTPTNTFVTTAEDQVLSGVYQYRVIATAGSISLTVNWERAAGTGAISIVKVVGSDGQPISL